MQSRRNLLWQHLQAASFHINVTLVFTLPEAADDYLLMYKIWNMNVSQRALIIANCSICEICLMIICMSCFFPHQQGTGDSKAKGNNTSGNSAPHGNVAQQCSACSRVCTVALFHLDSSSERKQTILKKEQMVILCCVFSLPGGGAGTAGSTLPEFRHRTVGRKCTGNGRHAGVCWSTSWFRFLWNPQALCGSSEKDRHHLPSRFPHELPHV